MGTFQWAAQLLTIGNVWSFPTRSLSIAWRYSVLSCCEFCRCLSGTGSLWYKCCLLWHEIGKSSCGLWHVGVLLLFAHLPTPVCLSNSCEQLVLRTCCKEDIDAPLLLQKWAPQRFHHSLCMLPNLTLQKICASCCRLG